VKTSLSSSSEAIRAQTVAMCHNWSVFGVTGFSEQILEEEEHGNCSTFINPLVVSHRRGFMNMTLRLVSNQPSEEIRPWNRFTAARNRMASSLQTDPILLDRLARRVNTPVQLRVAENVNTDSGTLDLLAQHQSSDVRSAVAQNENSLRSTVDSLSVDDNCDVRYAMAENPWTNAKLLEKLAQDENPYVQHRAKRTQAQLNAEKALSAATGGLNHVCPITQIKRSK
jgi:hypothetical protein